MNQIVMIFYKFKTCLLAVRAVLYLPATHITCRHYTYIHMYMKFIYLEDIKVFISVQKGKLEKHITIKLFNHTDICHCLYVE